MNSKKLLAAASLSLLIFCFFLQQSSYAYEIFIYRPNIDKKPLFREKKLYLHGELFAHLQLPSTFPSYNDHSGPEDRFNYGFQNLIFLTENASILAQLITHDDGHKRTKFDWHFSFRYEFVKNLVFIVGHDSNHDSDYQSLDSEKKKPFFTNRNYVGVGFPFEGNNFYIEPFTWFFHHTNQRGHLDLSGNKLKQEFGIRIGVRPVERLSLNFQLFFQTEELFSLGQAYWGDIILRIKLLEWIELSLGGTLWKDIVRSGLDNKKEFYKFIWGIAIPF